LYLTRSTYELTFPQAGELSILQVPSESLGVSAESLSQIAARSLHIRQDGGLRTLARVVRSLFTERPVIEDSRQALRVATEILGSVLRQRGGTARARSHAALFAAFDRVIHERLDDPRLGVATLALTENVSARMVHSVFAERGMTPASYIREKRIGRAQSLLASTNLSLADIGVRCGIVDPSVFSRTFRSARGVTPTEYRRTTSDSSS
jgi:transcriptional regulator GlxA family with amidase domain